MGGQAEISLPDLFLEVASRGEAAVNPLARRFRLKPAALAENFRPLVKKGILVFREGRAKVAINASWGHVVGVDLGASHLHFALADFRGEILDDYIARIRPEDGPQRMIEQMQAGIRALTARHKEHGQLKALAMAVPSAVDAERGVVSFANNLPGWTNIHLGDELERDFRIPVFLENDANMAAIGEHWRGVARGVNNFVFIAIGTGIGSGIFVDGKLYRGHSGWAGELFRMNVEWQRWEEDFGDSGHLESYVSGMGISAEGRGALGEAAPAQPAGLAQERDAHFVFDAFQKGDPQARAVLEKIFTLLGVGIANVVAILDPDLIVIGGGIAQGAPEFMLGTAEKVVRAIQKDVTPPLKLSALGDKAQTLGAIHCALRLACEHIARKSGRRK
jgi:glucokinase